MRLSVAGIVGEPSVPTEGTRIPTIKLLWTGPMKALFALQAADIVTTVIFRSMGLAESNPLVDSLMGSFGTLGGLIVVKAGALGVALSVGIANRPSFVRRINWVYCGIIALNVLTILHAWLT